MGQYTATITGISPLLMHHDNIEAQDAENARGKSGGKAGDDRCPADRWKSYLYVADGKVVMPASNILSSLGKVGGSISIGGKKNLKAASQAVVFDDIYLPFAVGASQRIVTAEEVEAISGEFNEHRRAVQPLGFEIQVAPCSVNGKRHIRTRPMFSIWSIVGAFDALDDDLTLPRLRELFSVAGRKSGLGDWRPGAPKKPGSYGRFLATVK